MGWNTLASVLAWVCSTIFLDSSISKVILQEIPWSASPSGVTFFFLLIYPTLLYIASDFCKLYVVTGNTVSWDCLVSWSAPSHLELVWSVVKPVFCEFDGSLCLFMNFGSSSCKLSTDLCNNHCKLSTELCNNLKSCCYTFFWSFSFSSLCRTIKLHIPKQILHVFTSSSV